MPDEPSANSSYQFAHVLTAYAIAVTIGQTGHPWWGVAAAVAIASLKEWVVDPILEHDGLGWWNAPPLSNVGGSLQDWTFWMLGAGIAAVILRWL